MTITKDGTQPSMRVWSEFVTILVMTSIVPEAAG